MEERERRMSLRVRMPETQHVQLGIRHRVQLIDISLSGALLASDVMLPVGAQARLRTGLVTGPFVANLEVRRQQSANGTEASSPALGAMFMSMDAVSRRSLELFLRRTSE